jgi:hypothetical protein
MAGHNNVATANSRFFFKVLQAVKRSAAQLQCQNLSAALLVLAFND